MDNMRGVFAGVAMALGLLVVCVGLAVKLIDDTGWALVAGGVLCLVAGAVIAQVASEPVKASSTP